MTTNQIQSLLKAVLEQIKDETFVDPVNTSDSKAMGILLSKYFEYDGLEILKATYSALEDSNFHSENEVIQSIINKLEKPYETNPDSL